MAFIDWRWLRALPLALVGLLALPAAANAACTATANGTIHCASTTTKDTTDVNGVPPVSNASHYIYTNGSAIDATIATSAKITGFGLVFEQGAAAPAEVAVSNAGRVVTTQDRAGLAVLGNGGHVSYSGSGSASTTSLTAAALELTNTGSGTIDLGTAAAPIGGTFSGGIGIYAGGVPGSPVPYNGNVGIEIASGSITGLSTAAIEADTHTGSGNITVVASGSVTIHGGAGATGILASAGSGAVAVVTNADIGATAERLATGISASSASGSADLSVTENGGTMFTSGTGINATNGGSGRVTLLLANGTKVDVNGTTAIGMNTAAVAGITSITLAGATTVDAHSGTGLKQTSTTGALNVVLNSATSISGNTAFDVTTTSGVTTIENAGAVNITTPVTAGLKAIMQTGGGVVFDNTGTVAGGFGLGATTGANTITNSKTWTLSGTNSFGSGTDAITNKSGATMTISSCAPSCSFAFGGSGTDTITNAGTLSAGSAAGDVIAFTMSTGTQNTLTNSGTMKVFGALSFANLATFTNTAGTLDMRQSTATGNHNTDSVTVSGTYAAGAGSTLGVDVFLGGAGSTADALHVGGAVTGKTTINIADTNADSGGLTGASGITLVTSGSDLPTDAFTLGSTSTVKGGSVETINGVTVLHKGFFDYSLANPTPKTLALVSAPSIGAAETPLIAVGAKTIWYQTAVDYQNRLAGTISDQNDRVGFWGQGIGSWTRRWDSSPEVLGGKTVQRDLDYHQDIWGFLGGFDFASGAPSPRSGGLLKFGVMGGVVDGNLAFDKPESKTVKAANFNYTGPTAGVSLLYRLGRAFVDVMGKVDVLHVQVRNLSQASGETQFGIDSTTWGGMGNLGWHFHSRGFFFDPMLTLAGTSTTTGHIANKTASAEFDFGAQSTFRGALGFRAGGAAYNMFEDGALEASMTARAWNQFDGNRTTVSLVTTGTPTLLDDRMSGTFGEVDFRLEWVTSHANQTSAFIESENEFNGDFMSNAIKGGLRMTW